MRSDQAMAEHSTRPERPRLEPEIIPPRRERRDGDWRPYVATMSGTHRIYVAQLGPLRMGLLMAVVAILVAVTLLAVLGAVLVWIPIFALLLGVGVIFRLLRR